MAQWIGGYSGRTHDTKVRDVEDSLRLAVESYRSASDAERAGKLKAIRHLADKLLAVRLKALRARMSALSEPGKKRVDAKNTARLLTEEQALQAQGVDDVLREFGV